MLDALTVDGLTDHAVYGVGRINKMFLAIKLDDGGDGA